MPYINDYDVALVAAYLRPDMYQLDRTMAMAVGVLRALKGAPCEECGEEHGK